MTVTDIALTTLDGTPTTLAQYADGAVLVVNVASKCGLTPQYTALEKLAQDYGDRGLTVIGVPCNQFMGQEPGTAEEIQTSSRRHPVELREVPAGAWWRRGQTLPSAHRTRRARSGQRH